VVMEHLKSHNTRTSGSSLATVTTTNKQRRHNGLFKPYCLAIKPDISF
jgi:hypothetical protein